MTGFDLPQGMMTVFVTGEQDVKTYPVALGNSVNLIDEENGRMYIKGRDASGMPRQTRIFEIKEITPVLGMPGDVVTRKEFDELKGSMGKIMDALTNLQQGLAPKEAAGNEQHT